MNIEQAVREFHETFVLPIGEKARHFTGNDTFTSPKRRLRMDLLDEEILEYWHAEMNDDIVGIADALADIVYIAVGTAVAYGIPFNEVFEEVHASNMSKLGDTGEPIYRDDGKVLKGPDYFEPNVRKILFDR